MDQKLYMHSNAMQYHKVKRCPMRNENPDVLLRY